MRRRQITQVTLRNSWTPSARRPARHLSTVCFTYRGLWHVHFFKEWLDDHCEILPCVVSPTLNQLVSRLLREAQGTGVRGSPRPLGLCATSFSATGLDGVRPGSEATR